MFRPPVASSEAHGTTSVEPNSLFEVTRPSAWPGHLLHFEFYCRVPIGFFVTFVPTITAPESTGGDRAKRNPTVLQPRVMVRAGHPVRGFIVSPSQGHVYLHWYNKGTRPSATKLMYHCTHWTDPIPIGVQTHVDSCLGSDSDPIGIKIGPTCDQPIVSGASSGASDATATDQSARPTQSHVMCRQNNRWITLSSSSLVRLESPRTPVPSSTAQSKLQDDASAQVITVKRNHLEQIQVEGVQIILWEYATRSYDIEFSVKFRPRGTEEGNEVVVRKPVRVEAHTHNRIGAVVTCTPGVLILGWNNSYSRFRNKQLTYKVSRCKGCVPLNTPLRVRTPFGDGTILEYHHERGTFLVDVGAEVDVHVRARMVHMLGTETAENCFSFEKEPTSGTWMSYLAYRSPMAPLQLPTTSFTPTTAASPADITQKKGKTDTSPPEYCSRPAPAIEVSCISPAQFDACTSEDAGFQLFEQHKLSLEALRQDPARVTDVTQLVFRVDGAYCDWTRAGPSILATAVFGETLSSPNVSPAARKTSVFPFNLLGYSSEEPPKSPVSVGGHSPILTSVPPAPPPFDLATPVGRAMSSPPRPKRVSNWPDSGNRRVVRRRNSKRYVQSLVPTSEQLASFNLRDGRNTITFEVTSSYRGTSRVSGSIFLWSSRAKIVVSDVDGTITKSDVMGHLMYWVGRDWTQKGVAALYTKIKENGYKFIYLTSRAIGQVNKTKDYLTNINQDNVRLPDGAVITSPDRVLKAFTREVILRRPQEFKIKALQDVRDAFPADHNPFFAGFGNRDSDVMAYNANHFPKGRIFIINPDGEIRNNSLMKSSYNTMAEMAELMFPPFDETGYGMARRVGGQPKFDTQFSDHNYWKSRIGPVRKNPFFASGSSSDDENDA